MEEPQELVYTLLKHDSHKRIPAWERELIQEAKRYGALEGMHRERKSTNRYNNYVSLLCGIIDKEPSNYEEDPKKKEWKDGMIKEYQLIMKNDV